MNNNNIVFIFGTPETDLALTPEIPRLLKLACYIPLDEILVKCQPRVIRYLMDEDWVVRCWGCHRLLTEFAYPYNFCGPPKFNHPIIFLCCSHNCQAFLKYFKTAKKCDKCNQEFIPGANKLPGNSSAADNNNSICPSCWFNEWSQKLSARISLAIMDTLNILITTNITNFTILNKCHTINK